MLRKSLLALLALTTASSGLAFADSAEARGRGHHRDYRVGDYYGGDRYGDRYDNRRYDNRRYDNRRYDDRRYYNNRRYRCDDGTGGAVIGAIAGGLIGHEAADYHNKGSGTLIGAVIGGIAGHAIDKSDGRGCR